MDAALLPHLQDLDAFADEQGWSRFEKFNWYLYPTEIHVNPRSQGRGILTPESLYIFSSNMPLCTLRIPQRERVFSQLANLIENSIHPIIETAGCGAHTGMWFFDPFHNIYTCAEQVGKAHLAVGTFAGGTPAIGNNSIQKWHARHVGSVEACSKCAYAFFCGGGCANAALTETGTLFAPRCFGIQKAFEMAATEFVQEAFKSGQLNRDMGKKMAKNWVLPLVDQRVVQARLSGECYLEKHAQSLC